MTEVPSKECWNCKTTKPLTEYYLRSSMPDKHQYNCKDCQKSINMAHYWEMKKKRQA